MRAKILSLASITVLAGLAGCGDNSKTCGPGTEDVDGVCTGSGGGQCTDGTILVDDHCEIDPNSCQDGTVLMGDQCVDPATHTATIEEAVEPNALGLFGEDSNDPAGEIALKPVGEHFTIHGKIIPFQDADGDGQLDADVDSYLLNVTAPTMISVSADGLHGLAGGFVAIAAASGSDPLASWTRFGVNPAGDTAKRQIYLPAAGTYLIAIADSRSLFLTGAAPGGTTELPMEYYVTVDQLTATPTTLTPTGGVASSSGQLTPGEVKLFSVTMGEGINDAELDMTIDQVQESMVIANTRASATTVRAVVDGDPGIGATAGTQLLGIRANDSQVIVVDTVFDYANAPYDYDLTVNVRGAVGLSTNGGNIMQPADDIDFSTFYYDVSAGGLLTGMNLSFDRPVAGVIVDQDFFIYSRFSYNGSGFAATFTSYKGLLKHFEPGRYYFLVFDPEFDSAAGPDDIVATSTYGTVETVAVTKGTPLADQMTNAYGSNPFTYTSQSATAPWQLFNATGTGTGAITGTFYRPDAAGRLDSLALSPACTACNDSPAALFTHTYAENGSTPRGRILLDDTVASYFVKVRPATAGTFSLDFKDQTYTNVGPLTVGTPQTEADQVLDNTVTVQRYLVRTANENRLSTTVHPHPGVLIDTRINPINADESAKGSAINNGGINADDTWTVTQGGAGWTAFTVTAPATQLLGGAFDLTVAALPPPYAKAAGTTPFADACAGGTVVAMTDLDEGRSSAVVTPPTGFQFFGATAGNFRIFSNGFLSFDTALACQSTGSNCFFTNADIPTTANPNGLIAPYWDDLVLDQVCTKTIGTKLIVQWTGAVFFGDLVNFQVILDGSDSTIEFVYDTAGQVENGSGATIGLESLTATEFSKIGFNTAGTATPRLLTPQ